MKRALVPLFVVLCLAAGCGVQVATEVQTGRAYDAGTNLNMTKKAIIAAGGIIHSRAGC